MLGAIIGDIAGSRFEGDNIKKKEFEFFAPACVPTDDSVLTLAVAEALLRADAAGTPLEEEAVRALQAWGRAYPRAGYGGSFMRWLRAPDPRPYGSYGNGAAMRVSPCGYRAASAAEACRLAEAVTGVTHDHPEALKAARAVAESIFLLRGGMTKAALRAHVEARYYALDFTLDDIRASYGFDVSCQGSVPQAFVAFFEAVDFEDAVRNAISIGGDSDTIAAIAGSLAEPCYGIPEPLRAGALAYLDARQRRCLEAFESAWPR